MTQPEFAKWADYAARVGSSFHRVLARYGWDVDDCCQHAYLTLLTLPDPTRPDPETQKILFVVIRRALLMEARRLGAAKRRGVVYGPVEQYIDKRRDWATEFMVDVLADAPPDVRDWLNWDFFAGDDPGHSERTMRRLRHKAARWLLKMFELTVKS